MAQRLLEVEDLYVEFSTRDGTARAVNGVSFTLDRGQTVAILGESGSGKSVTAQAIMGILDTPPARIAGGSIKLEGLELIGLPEAEYRQVRGRQIAMIFQDALSALNPVMSVGEQIAEMFRIHQGLDRRSARDAAVEVMVRVRIPAAAERFGNYPHEFSGGMRQRIMIAMMIALKPAVLIADEPTTALDVTVQSQIMDLLAELKEETNMGLILITHDLGVVADVAERILVMYAGRTMERGSVDEIYTNTANPYTYGLLASIPKIDHRIARLPAIPGLPPSLYGVPAGCAFNPRCPMATDRCRAGDPPELMDVARDHSSRCWYAQEVLAHGVR
ncbi:MAG: ABC transporter ATP-binding protein [Candidatus Nanopelagicales bacterium]